MAVIRRQTLTNGDTEQAITTGYPDNGLALTKPPTSGKSPTISGVVSGLFIFFHTLSTATSVSVVVTDDAAGDRPLMPETSAILQTGMTTATKGSAVLNFDGLQVYDSNEPVFCWIKTNAGTLTVYDIILTYGE